MSTADVAAMLDALPEPAEKDAFLFDAELFLAQSHAGSGSYEMRVAPGAAKGEKGPARWEARESQTIEGAPTTVQDTSAILDRSLRVQSYERTSRQLGGDSGTTKVVWAESGAMTVTRSNSAGEEASNTVPAKPGASRPVATLAAVIRLARSLPDRAQSFDLPIFVFKTLSPEVAKVEVRGKGKFEFMDRALDATVVVITVAGFEFDVYLAPETRAPIAVAQPTTSVTFVAKGLGFVEDVEPLDVSGPAASARDCVMRFELGMLSGEVALMENAVHWPSLMEAEVARTGEKASAETFRMAMLTRWRLAGASEKRPKADAIVRASAAKAVEEKDGEFVFVRLRAPLGAARYKTKAFDGEWKVVDRVESDDGR
jgi:hypothetical protein